MTAVKREKYDTRKNGYKFIIIIISKVLLAMAVVKKILSLSDYIFRYIIVIHAIIVYSVAS